MLKITILTDDLVRRRNLLAEHGLSLWIEDGPEKVLFDLGQSEVYLHNAKALGIDLTKTQAIVLSHGHFDHGGGLPFYPQEGRWPKVYVHPDAFLPRFVKMKNSDEPDRSIGLPWERNSLENLEKRLIMNTATTQVGERLFACTAIPQITDFETPSDDLFVEKDGYLQKDAMFDEQLLVCKQDQGLTVVLGCSHPGVVNCLKFVQQLFPDQSVYALIGGMHLEKASRQRLEMTMKYFEKLDIQKIVPLHCTGQEVIWQMKKKLGDRIAASCTGDVIEIKSRKGNL